MQLASQLYCYIDTHAHLHGTGRGACLCIQSLELGSYIQLAAWFFGFQTQLLANGMVHVTNLREALPMHICMMCASKHTLSETARETEMCSSRKHLEDYSEQLYIINLYLASIVSYTLIHSCIVTSQVQLYVYI